LKGRSYSKKDLVEKGDPIILYGRLYTNYETKITEVNTYVKGIPDSIISRGNEVIVPASGETAEDIARASAIAKSGIILGGDLNIIYPDPDIDSVFLALSISNGNPQKELSTKAQGKSVVHLRNPDFKNLELFFPCIDEQRKISEYFENINNLITLHQCKYFYLIYQT
jgi:type I restriction enzyme S subunit